LSVKGELPPLPSGVTDLKFREFFKSPIGQRGLEPTKKLLELNGKPVRLIGYMAKQEQPPAGVFILALTPIFMGDEDEVFADDLLPTSVYVHLGTSQTTVPFIPGLIHLTGVLNVGSQVEEDGRISSVRLMLDPALTNELTNSQQRYARK